MGEAPGWVGLFLVAGGCELPVYLTERRRLAESRRRRELAVMQRDKATADLQLAVLQAQIEPHFLFNTLASLRSLVKTEPERAVSTINALSDYLRSTLPKLRGEDGLATATLSEQVEICTRYLELMNVRMGGRLEVTIDLEDGAGDLPFPPLLLISLVENAVKHGVEPKPGPGSIAIRARLRPGTGSRAASGTDADAPMLEVAVEDDGVGLKETLSDGVGLANVGKQLQHRFGERASLTVSSREQGGVRAQLLVPCEV